MLTIVLLFLRACLVLRTKGLQNISNKNFNYGCFSNIKELWINDCALSNEDARVIVTNCTSLEKLRLHRIEDFDSDGYRYIVDVLSKKSYQTTIVLYPPVECYCRDIDFDLHVCIYSHAVPHCVSWMRNLLVLFMYSLANLTDSEEESDISPDVD